MNRIHISHTNVLVLGILFMLLLSIGITSVTASVGGVPPVEQPEPRDQSVFLGKYLDLRTGFITKYTLADAQNDLSAGILSSPEMGIISQEYALNDNTPSVAVDSSTLAIEEPEGFYTWVPSDDIIESISWYVTDQKNRDQVTDYLVSGIIPETTGNERNVRSHATTINNALDLAKLQNDILIFVGIGGDELKHSDSFSYYQEPSFTYASLDPSVAIADAIKKGRDSEGYADLLVIHAPQGSPAFSANDDEKRMILMKGLVWYATREVITDNLALDLPFAATNADNYTKVRLLYVEEMPEWYQERIGLIEPET